MRNGLRATAQFNKGGAWNKADEWWGSSHSWNGVLWLLTQSPETWVFLFSPQDHDQPWSPGQRALPQVLLASPGLGRRILARLPPSIRLPATEHLAGVPHPAVWCCSSVNLHGRSWGAPGLCLDTTTQLYWMGELLMQINKGKPH